MRYECGSVISGEHSWKRVSCEPCGVAGLAPFTKSGRSGGISEEGLQIGEGSIEIPVKRWRVDFVELSGVIMVIES